MTFFKLSQSVCLLYLNYRLGLFKKHKSKSFRPKLSKLLHAWFHEMNDGTPPSYVSIWITNATKIVWELKLSKLLALLMNLGLVLIQLGHTSHELYKISILLGIFWNYWVIFRNSLASFWCFGYNFDLLGDILKQFLFLWTIFEHLGIFEIILQFGRPYLIIWAVFKWPKDKHKVGKLTLKC